MKYVIFAAFIMVAVVMVASEGDECIAWKGQDCQELADCCRGLRCKTLDDGTKMCIPILGMQLPGMDKRPLGPGPYPPNVKP